MKQVKRFYKFLCSEQCGKHAGKIVLGTFAVMFMGLYVLANLAPIKADAVNTVKSKTESSINDVRMASIEEVFLFDDTVPTSTKENITMYLYSTVDSVELLGMLNNREHVIFSKNTDGCYIKDHTLYVSTSISVDVLNQSIDKLKESR